MAKYVARRMSEDDKIYFLNLYKTGRIDKANIPMEIFRNDIDSLIELGIYWEKWDSVYYKDLFGKLEGMSSHSRIDYINGKKFIGWGNVNFIKLPNVFFPHMWEAKSYSKPSLKTVWNNRDRMIVLLKRFLADKKVFTAEEKTMKFFRKFMRSLSGGYFTYNYKPDISKVIYDLYGNRGKIFDFSMGWAGRLVGFLASDAREYVGVDVNHKNFKSYRNVVKAYGKKGLGKKKVSFFETPAEDFCPEEYHDYFDLSFSSPPYFVKEIYSDDPNQHHLRYGDDFETWCDGFLKPMIKNQYKMLKKGGRLIINIADVTIKTKTYPLERYTVDYAKSIGFIEDEPIYMKINKSPFMRNKNVNDRTKKELGFKFERVFIFTK